MLGYLAGGFLRLLFRLWTFGLLFFLENRLFLWIKGITTPQLPYKKITPFDGGIIPRKNCRDSRMFIPDPIHHSWNGIVLSSLTTSKKLPYIWASKKVMIALQSSEQSVHSMKSDRELVDNSTLDIWNSQSVSIENILGAKNFKTDSIFGNSCYLMSKDILPKDFDKKKEKINLVEPCFFRDFYTGIGQKEKEKIGLMEPNNMACGSCEKNGSSAGSIDSGFQSFHSVKSAYTCIEEGITLYVSDCRYNTDGKLIYMTVGFGINEDSISDDSLPFDSELLEEESDLFCENDDESEEFIVFDADSSCDETDTCFLESFVFEGTADKFSVAMSLNDCRNSSVEIRITQTNQNSSPCCFPCEENDYSNKVTQDTYLSDTEDKKTKQQFTNSNYSAGTVHKKKKVQFQVEKNKVHDMVAWDFAYRQARVGHWNLFATDRLQFQRRIDQTAKIIEPVLEKKLLQMKN